MNRRNNKSINLRLISKLISSFMRRVLERRSENGLQKHETFPEIQVELLDELILWRNFKLPEDYDRNEIWTHGWRLWCITLVTMTRNIYQNSKKVFLFPAFVVIVIHIKFQSIISHNFSYFSCWNPCKIPYKEEQVVLNISGARRMKQTRQN